jgi:hypothetical protein
LRKRSAVAGGSVTSKKSPRSALNTSCGQRRDARPRSGRWRRAQRAAYAAP